MDHQKISPRKHQNINDGDPLLLRKGVCKEERREDEEE